jgi:hypothetical protein
MQYQTDFVASVIVIIHSSYSEPAATSESPSESSAEQSVSVAKAAPVKLPELTPPAAAVATVADTQQLTTSHHNDTTDGTAISVMPIARPFSPVTTTAAKNGSFRRGSTGSRIAFGCVNSPPRSSASTTTVTDTAALAETVSKVTMTVSKQTNVSAVENDASSDSTATEAAVTTSATTANTTAGTAGAAAVRTGKLVRPVARRGHAKTNSAAELELPVAEITADIDTLEPAVAAVGDTATAAPRKGSSGSSTSNAGQLHEPAATARGASAGIAVDPRR